MAGIREAAKCSRFERRPQEFAYRREIFGVATFAYRGHTFEVSIRRLAVSSRSDNDFDAGYTPDFFAFKHGLTIQQAITLIHDIGPSRARLDAAAIMLREKLALEEASEVALALNGNKSQRPR